MNSATGLLARVDATSSTVQHGCVDPAAPPVARVELGEAVLVRTVQGTTHDDVPAAWIRPELAEIESASSLPRGPGPHLLTGPVAVRGVRAGERVGVTIDAVELASPYGFQRLRPGRGVLPDEVDRVSELMVPIVDGAGVVPSAAGAIRIPLRPFPGIVATAPPPSGGALTSAEPGPHGGNLDCTELVAGSTLFLPTSVDEVHLSIGDGHAVQGDGEVGLTALETCLDVTVRVDVAPEVPATPAPLAVTPAGLVVMGMAATLDAALEEAVSTTVEVLASSTSLDRRTAYRVCSMAAHARITQAVCATRTVHLLVPGAVLGAMPGRAAWLHHGGWA
jgi:acetamidase/formamidase